MSDLLTRFSKGSGQIFPTEEIMKGFVGHPYENMQRNVPSQTNEKRVTFSENVNEQVIEPNNRSQDLIEPFFSFGESPDNSFEKTIEINNEPNNSSEEGIIEPYSNGSFSQYGSPYGGR